MILEDLKQKSKEILKECQIEFQEENGILFGKEKNNMTIYCHINRKTNGVYIGQTVNIKTRWGENGKGYQRQKTFWSAIAEYGWRNFSHNVLVQNVPNEIINQLEIKLIKYSRENGECYNIKDGGIQNEHPTKTINNLMKQKINTSAQKEPPFVKVYLDTMLSFQGIKGINSEVLLNFCHYISYCNADKSQMQITFNKINKQEITQRCGISVNMVNKNIRKFVDGGIFFKTECRGVYTVNPFLLAKGEWKNIKELRSQFDFVNGTWTMQKEILMEDN